MSYPAEGVESAIKNHIDDVREFLDTHHADSYAVYNLSNRCYRAAKFQNRVSVSVTFIWVNQRAVSLSLFFSANLIRGWSFIRIHHVS